MTILHCFQSCNRNMFKVLNVTETRSMTRKGKPSDYFAVDIDYMGEKVKVRTPKADVKPGDYVKLGYDVERNEHCAKLMIAIKSVVPGADVEGQEETAEPESRDCLAKRKGGGFGVYGKINAYQGNPGKVLGLLLRTV